MRYLNSYVAAWAGVFLAAIALPAIVMRKISGGAMSWLAAIIAAIAVVGVPTVLRGQAIKYDGLGQPVNPTLNRLFGNWKKAYGIIGGTLFAIGAVYALIKRKK
ncbi:hypothetical protein Ga0100230_004605 [Opitutaceae bacterium TAV3]|nr:hypothetical protein Ga0100230_004605 [Opitutaceae bacterium TAV3]